MRSDEMDSKTLAIVREMDGIRSDGSRSKIKISMGTPYPSDDFFKCPIGIEGIHFDHSFPDMVGVDALQSIHLASLFAKRMLEDFVEHGGRLYYSGSEDEYELSDW